MTQSACYDEFINEILLKLEHTLLLRDKFS